MNAFAQLSSEERGLFCRQASEKLSPSIPPAVIEKDFWVCWTLLLLSEIEALKGNITFKGGTSLSKGWGLIERFSEDIDIAINRNVFGQGPPNGPEDTGSNRQRRIRLEELEESCALMIREVVMPNLQAKIAEHVSEDFDLRFILKGNEVSIGFEYPSKLKTGLGGLLPVVLIELVPRADDIPNNTRAITPIIHHVFEDLLGSASFIIPTLAPERTFIEKLLLIHETLEGFNIGSERKSRHYYDLFMLYNAGIYDKVKLNRALVEAVVNHRKTFYRYNRMDYASILTKGIKLLPAMANMPEWRSDYLRTRVMIFGKIPSFDDLMHFAEQLEMDFNNWVAND
jgi:predicted nucleotidyltransferase component of viral defense system